LEGYAYKMLVAALLFLFAAQVVLTDLLEALLMKRMSYRTRWFTLLIAPGTILHELCHLMAALATGGNIVKAALFKPNPQTGVLGYVNYSQPLDKWVVFREFIIAFAPFFGCGLLLFAFNIPYGAGFIGLMDESPMGELDELLVFTGAIFEGAKETLTLMHWDKPLIWFFAYLQVCFAVGAAPSTVDFRGAFTSLWKHKISAFVFLCCIAFLYAVTNDELYLLGLEKAVSYVIVLALKFMVLVLTLSTALTATALPIVYAGTKVSDIKGLAKTIPFTAALITLFSLQEYGLHAIAVTVLVFAAVVQLLTIRKNS
jgi:hypothetical protein